MTKLELIEIDKKHDCPVGQYEKGCFDGEGSGQCLQCGMNKQRDSDQSVVDGLDKQIEALQQEVERLKGIAIKVVEDEPEFPSEMPDALWLQMQLLHGKEDYTQLMRNVVSLTKTCIIKRLQAALASKEGEK